jgi:hypothetical protein
MFKRIVGFVFYFEAIMLYFMFFGTTETTVNVRAANRGISVDMGVIFYQIFFLMKKGFLSRIGFHFRADQK